MSKLIELSKLGQSVWFDFISRKFLVENKLKALVDDGVRGVTSNPSIFEKAIAGSSDYDEDLKSVLNSGLDIQGFYEALVLKDISWAADILMPVYEATKGYDGFVSIEVNPDLASDTLATIEQGKRLFKTLNKPNIMIKVPATQEGLPAVTELIASGVNVNTTLIFSLENYIQVAKAYLVGLKLLKLRGGDLSKVASVASFFVSRVDSAVDKELEKVGDTSLLGKIAVANAKLSYKEYGKLFSGTEWEELAESGAQTQRVLWASTGTKNVVYKDVLYLDELIGVDTVNTVPPATLDAFIDHGIVSLTLDKDVVEAQQQFDKLKELGIDIGVVTDQLQVDGVKLFADAFVSLINSLKAKVAKLRNERAFSASLGGFTKNCEEAASKLFSSKIISRIWDRDYTVWSESPVEISNRLGWLDCPEVTLKSLSEINDYVEEIKSAGFKKILLLGMGGSSLAPEVFSFTFGKKEGYPTLDVLDSTDPQAVLNAAGKNPPEETLYIVSTKSGGTVETFSFMKYFYNLSIEKLGVENAGKHFTAITDPGSGLEVVAKELKFRKVFLNDPNIGGRYSALSLFGMVPAALIGIDIEKLLNRAGEAAQDSKCSIDSLMKNNTATQIGAAMGEFAKLNRDKVTFILSNSVKYFGCWVEQLIAESCGKNGKGILPVDGEEVLSGEFYGKDRLFVHLKLRGENEFDEKINSLKNSGEPVIEIVLEDLYDFGREFFNWEFATSVASSIIQIQPFDQPNVESAKILSREVVKKYQTEGKLDIVAPAKVIDDVKVYGHYAGESASDILQSFLYYFQEGGDSGLRSYISLQAYVTPTDETTKQFELFRNALQKILKGAVTFGYGPRFLHSTGQLHKGDAGNGLFIQFTTATKATVNIPDEAGSDKSSMTFGVLRTAQAYGDRQALLNNDRHVLWFDVEGDLNKLLTELTTGL